MTLLDILDKNLIKVPVLSTNKKDLVSELINIYKDEAGFTQSQADNFISAVIDRELQASTAMGNGVAIPHAKIPELEKAAVIIGISRLGIDFGGDEKSKVFFLVLAPSDKPSEHIQLLSSIARLSSSPVFCRMMQNAKDRDEVLQLLTE